MNRQRPTPREILKDERHRLQQACLLQERRLNEDFAYVQEHAGSLLLSGLSMFYPKRTKSRVKESEDQKRTAPATDRMPVSFGFADYLSLIQSLLPVAWDVMRPMITAWGIRKIQTWMIRKLFTKKESGQS